MAKKPETIQDLKPDTNNANKGTVRGLAMLEDSIEELGAGRSILIDDEANVIAGNKTLQAAYEKGLEIVVVQTTGDKLVVVQRTDLNLYKDKRARELAYADNRVAQVDLEWDSAALLRDLESGLDLSSYFDQDELAALLDKVDSDTPPDPGPDVDQAEQLLAKWKVKPGDLWAIGNHRLLCGDSTKAADLEWLLAGAKAQAVITDVPYGISQKSNGLRRLDYGEWDQGDADQVALAALDLCQAVPSITAFCADEQLSTILKTWTKRTCRTIAWIKPNPTVINGDHVFLPAIELAAHGRLSRAWFGGHCVRSVWEGPPPAKRIHPTEKPLELFTWLIEHTCPPGKAVYDPFAGSGTILVAAEQTKRRGLAIEKEPKYVAVALERIAGMGLTPEKV